MPQSRISNSQATMNRWPAWEWALLALIICLALALRLWRLDSVPPGLTHDEASNGHDAAAVLRGVRPIYFTVGYGHEPLYPYSVAPVMALLGANDTTLRLTTVGWGLALILLSYGFARRLFGPLPALLTAAGMATSFWCVMTSRVGLRAITLAATFTASAFCFWMACPLPAGEVPASRRRWVWWALSGAFLGASIYTYMASRAMPAVYLLFLAYILVLRLSGTRPSYSHQQWARMANAGGIAVLLLVAALVAAPLVHFLVTHPGAEQRIGQLSAPFQQAAQGDFGGLWRRISRTLPMFTFQGDPLWLYNIPGRPLLDAVSGALFYAGILVCLWRWRDPRYTFLLLWLIVGAGPALLTGPDATVLRSIAAQPVIFIVAALALVTIVRFLTRQAGRWGQVVGVASVVALTAGVGLRTAHDYFTVWGEHRDVRVAYHHTLVQEARYLDAQPEGGTVALSSIYPGRFHDPYTVELALHRDDLAVRWFDGRFALIFPAGEETRVIIPTIAPLDEALEPLFSEHASHVYTENLRSDDVIPRFDVYRFDAAGAMATLLSRVEDNPAYWYPSDVFPAEEPPSAYEPLALPVDFDVVELIGYDLRTPVVGPGEEVELLTVWRVRAPFALEAVVFTHLLDDGGHVVGQVDRLDVPSYHWQPGDAFVQVHRFPVDAAATPGLYHLEVGIYTREDLARLPVLVNGTAVDDRALLSPVEVTDQ
jgi:4-amino-4-deoxy-L-arabinose transferase-like glycosyltransferase